MLLKFIFLIFLIKKHVLHYENLHFYLRLGLKIKRIHGVLEFNQSKWLKQYFEFNAKKTKETEKNRRKDDPKML